VFSHKTEADRRFVFISKKHNMQDNSMAMDLHVDNGILGSALGYHREEDGIYFSDIQRYACISDDFNEIPIKEYHSQIVSNPQTREIAKILYDVSLKLNPEKSPDGTLDLTTESAAFMPFLGAEANLSKIFLAKDLGLNIQSATVQNIGEGTINFQMKFVPVEQNL
jgi:hypothetical protein